MGKSIPRAPLAWRVPDLDRMRASQRADSPQSRLTAGLFYLSRPHSSEGDRWESGNHLRDERAR